MSLSGDDYKYFDGKFSDLHSRITDIKVHGCAKAGQHDDHEKRISEIEKMAARTAGRASVLGALFGTLLGFFGNKFLPK
jgi:hypothetical protein